MAGVEGGADLFPARRGGPRERAIDAVVMGQLEQVLDLRQHLVLAIARVGDLGCPGRGANIVETVDQYRDAGRSRGLDLAHRKAAGVDAVLLLEPWRAERGQCSKVSDAIDAIDIKPGGVCAERRAWCPS